MPHISKRELSKKTRLELLRAFTITLTQIDNGREMGEFLSSLLSETEKIMLAKRLAIITLLQENIPESTIAATLSVTRETVARLHYHLELKGKGYQIALKKLADEKMFNSFKDFLSSLARYAARAAGGRVKPEILD